MKKFVISEEEKKHIRGLYETIGNDDPRMYHRYDHGSDPGIETFFKHPTSEDIARQLKDQLERDIYSNPNNPTNLGKGTRTMKIFLNNVEYTIEGFINQVKKDGSSNICHIIDEYEYNNKFLGATKITIKTDIKKCVTPTQQDTKISDEKKQEPTKQIGPKRKQNGCPVDGSEWYKNLYLDLESGRETSKSIIPNYTSSPETLCLCLTTSKDKYANLILQRHIDYCYTKKTDYLG